MSAAGVIDGCEFWERPGSPDIDFSEEMVSATRILKVAWANRWKVAKALTARPFQYADTITDDRDFPTWPSEFLESYLATKVDGTSGVRLTVKNINITPDFDGKQSDISTDSANRGIATYGYAQLIVSYGVETDRFSNARWSSVLNTSQVDGDNFTWSVGGATLSDLKVQRTFPAQEFQKVQRTSDLGESNNDKRIRNLTNAIEMHGTINRYAITFGFGDTVYTFDPFQVMLNSWEVTPTLRFGRWQNDIVYSFKISPAAMSFETINNRQQWPDVEGNAVGTWKHLWSPADKEYRLLADPQLQIRDHRLLFGQTNNGRYI